MDVPKTRLKRCRSCRHGAADVLFAAFIVVGSIALVTVAGSSLHYSTKGPELFTKAFSATFPNGGEDLSQA
jgi:hypothetical protein